MKYIYEIPIYDGALKNWRVLNVNSGSFYCLKYNTEKEAADSITVGEIRAGMKVRRMFICGLRDWLNQLR